MEAIETRYRTHTCGQLRKTDVPKEIRLAGWVHSYRDHGGLVFIDLRDRDGLTQLVFDADVCGKATHEESRKLRSEWVISVSGVVHAPRRRARQSQASHRRNRNHGEVAGSVKYLTHASIYAG